MSRASHALCPICNRCHPKHPRGGALRWHRIMQYRVPLETLGPPPTTTTEEEEEEEEEPELCGLCGARPPQPGHTACRHCA